MARLLTVLTAIFALLFLGEHYLRARAASARQLESALRPLRLASVDEVVFIEVVAADGRRWRYAHVDSSWRYPAYHDAFVLPQRSEHLLKSLLQTPASVVSAEPGDRVHYGLSAGSPTLRLLDAAGADLLHVRLGRGVPDARAGEAYVQQVGFDTIYHLHANPAHAFDADDPPMLDRRVRPRALKKGTVVHVVFAGAEDYSLRSLRRVLAELDESAMAGGPPSGPIYEWEGEFVDGEKICVASSAYAYLGYIDRLTWAALHNPQQTAAAFAEMRSIFLEDDAGHIDTLEVGGIGPQGRFLRYRTTGQVFSISQAKADLLFPVASALLDTLPRPNSYEQVEPYTPF